MSVIVRGTWILPFTVTLFGRTHHLGCWGVRGERHPSLPGHWWVVWLDQDTGRQAVWSGGEPAQGWYYEGHLHVVGTAFIE